VKGTVTALVDDQFTGLRRQRLDDFHLPGASAVTAGATVGGQRFAVGQVTAVGLIDVAGIDDRHPLMAGGIEQGGGMGDHPVEVFQDEPVLLLHVDDQQRVVIVHWANLIKGETRCTVRAMQWRDAGCVIGCSGGLSELFARSRSAWPKRWRAGA
jgi:hypothetical protein